MYWKRRAIVVGAVLLVLIGLIMLWPSGGSSNTSAASSPSPRPSASGGPSPAASPLSPPVRRPLAHQQRHRLRKCLGGALDHCGDGLQGLRNLRGHGSGHRGTKAGSEVTFTMTIANNSGAPCKRDVGLPSTGSRSPPVVITSGRRTTAARVGRIRSRPFPRARHSPCRRCGPERSPRPVAPRRSRSPSRGRTPSPEPTATSPAHRRCSR